MLTEMVYFVLSAMHSVIIIFLIITLIITHLGVYLICIKAQIGRDGIFEEWSNCNSEFKKADSLKKHKENKTCLKLNIYNVEF